MGREAASNIPRVQPGPGKLEGSISNRSYDLITVLRGTGTPVLQMRKLRLRSPAFSSTTPFRDYNRSTCFSVHRTLQFTRHSHICHLIISGSEHQSHPLFTDGESEAQRTGASRSQEERKCSVAGFQAKKFLSIKVPPLPESSSPPLWEWQGCG